MDATEFDRWSDLHGEAFPDWLAWLNKNPRVVKHQAEALANVDALLALPRVRVLAEVRRQAVHAARPVGELDREAEDVERPVARVVDGDPAPLGVSIDHGVRGRPQPKPPSARVLRAQIKRHNFGGGPASHGASLFHRTPGSIGQRQTPGRVFPGKRMSGHMGSVRVTTENLKVAEVDAARNLLLIRGAVPGSPGGQVIVRPSLKAARRALRKSTGK